MSSLTLYRLAAILLIAGGLVAGIAHIVHPPAPPSDPASLLRYAHASRPAHLLLFAGVMLVLFGLPAHFVGQRRPAGLLGLAGVTSLITGMLFADALHCVLEFSVFPVLIQQVPYATPGIVESTYSKTPLGVLQAFGQVLVFIGVPLTALAIWRSRVYQAWTALPLFVTFLLLISALIPATARVLGARFPVALYASVCVLGISLLQFTLREASPSYADVPESKLVRQTRGGVAKSATVQ